VPLNIRLRSVTRRARRRFDELGSIASSTPPTLTGRSKVSLREWLAHSLELLRHRNGELVLTLTITWNAVETMTTPLLPLHIHTPHAA